MKKNIKQIILSVATAIGYICITTTLALAQTSALIPDVKPSTGSKVTLVQNLPSGTWQTVLTNVINLILAITGSLALIAITVGGLMMIAALGNEEQINKGKGILMWAVMALAVIAASYGIVIGLTQLQIFQ